MSTQLQTWINGGKKNQTAGIFWNMERKLFFLFSINPLFPANISFTSFCKHPTNRLFYSIQSYTNMFGTFYSWALWSWQFQLSHHHWWQQTTLLPTADTLNSLKLQASFPSSPTRCLHTCNTVLWRASSSWTANTLIPHWYHPTFYFKW